MHLRITRTDEEGTTCLVVEGRLSTAHVDVLVEECGSLDGPLVLDLTKLRSVDAAGAVLLRQLASNGVEMRGMLTSIRMRVQQHPHLCPKPSVA